MKKSNSSAMKSTWAAWLFLAVVGRAAVEEQVIGPSAPEVQYIVSDRGAHLAAVTRKGSRLVVMVDGVAGPRFDQIVFPVGVYVDSRPNMGSMANPLLRHGGDQHTSPKMVTFSRDGSRFAYVGRVGTEWVLIADNKEVLRLPLDVDGHTGSSDFRIEFSGPSGSHLLFSRGAFLGNELWVDGQKWPGYFSTGGGGTDGTVDPLISPDGEHIAYVAQIDQNKRALILDGHDAGYLATNLQFTADSKVLIGTAQTPKGTAVLANGHVLFSAKQLFGVYTAPAGNRVAFVMGHEYPDHTRGQFVMLDGKPVEATLCHAGIVKFTFSPDGKHYAAVCSEAGNIFWIVSDGKKGEQYDMMGNAFATTHGGGVAFTPDSSKLVYLAHSANKYFVVTGEDESDAYDTIPDFTFSAQGNHVAWSGLKTTAPMSGVTIDGKTELTERYVAIDAFDFSPDGSHYAYFGGALHVDGKTLPLTVTHFLISPDGQHVAAIGYRPTDNKVGVWFDGELVYPNEHPIANLAFSTDGQHLFWMGMEPASGPNAAPGTFEQVTYADGKALARADMPLTNQTLTYPVGYSAYTVHPGWQVTGPSSLVWVAPVGSDVKRFTITPDGTNLASMLAEARAVKAAKPRK
jgi:hypothetical protein